MILDISEAKKKFLQRFRLMQELHARTDDRDPLKI